MTLRDIILRADEVYGEQLVWLYFAKPNQDHGDGLAEFIVRELSDVYAPTASDESRLYEAARVMEKAGQQCQRLAAMFLELAEK